MKTARIDFDGKYLFFICSGVKIAKRENKSWMPLVRGYEVTETDDGGIEITAVPKPFGCQGNTEDAGNGLIEQRHGG
jgi:hypothetical protein